MSIAAGFQSGIALGRAFNKGRERRRLEGIRTAAPEMSQGFTAEQGQQLEAMASAINPETGRPYYNVQAGQGGNYSVTPDFTEAQTPRTGMDTGSQFGVANVELQPTGLGRAGVVAQPIPFNQQRVTDFLGRRFEGELAPDRIEAMRSRAMAEGLSDPRQRQAALAEATRAERETEEAPLRRQALETQVEAGRLSLDRTRQELTAGERTAAAAKRTDDFNAWRSENPGADFGALTAKAQELGMGVDEQFKLASNLTGIGEQEFKMSQQRIQKLVQNKGLDGLLKAHKESNDLDPTSHFEVTRGKGGQVSLNRVDTATGQIIQPNVFSGNEAETTAYLNKAAMDPATIIDYTMNLEKTKLAMDKDRASTEASRAAIALRNQQQQMLSTQAAGSAEAQQIRAEFDALTPDEQVGAKGRALMNRFNMANQKAGATVPLGTAARPERPEFTNADLNSRAKLLLDSGMMDPDDPTKPLSAQQAIAMARAELSGTSYVSAVDRLILEIAAAREAAAREAAARGATTTPATAAAPTAAPTTPRQTGSMGVDTSRPRTNVNPVTGVPREAPVQAPNLVEATSRGLDAGQAKYVAYLQAKIAAGKKMTLNETAQAKRFGLQ